ncbi:MAG: glycosyltransferase family 2 protein, partial [Myxococcota bacterium]
GAEVVELDTRVPFTAARARNAGYARLRELLPELELVQFIDGDCELNEDWLATATEHLRANPDVGMVAGRRRERFPEASPYNRLADLEWDTPIGEAEEVGGDVLLRAAIFEEAGRYDAAMIAGEDPELCFRVRRTGHRVVRIDAEMTLHDANMLRFGQWWKRVTRSGHAYAEGAHMYGADEERYRLKELRSILFWGGAVPAASVTLAPLTLGTSLVGGGAAYGYLASRIYRYRRHQRADAPGDAALYATATTVGKVAEMRGVAEYAWNRFVKRKRAELIEYK